MAEMKHLCRLGFALLNPTLARTFVDLHLAPFSLSGFQRREASLKPSSLSGALRAPDNDARSELTCLLQRFQLVVQFVELRLLVSFTQILVVLYFQDLFTNVQFTNGIPLRIIRRNKLQPI